MVLQVAKITGLSKTLGEKIGENKDTLDLEEDLEPVVLTLML